MNHADMARIRIGIVTWNSGAYIAACLDALPEATAGLDAEVVVVDNASTDDTVEVVRACNGISVIANAQNRGYARGMNQALGRPGDAEVLIALNPDTVPPPGSLRSLVDELEADPTLGLVVPRLANPDGSLQHSVYRFPSPGLTAVTCLVPIRLQRGRLARRWWLEGRTPHDRVTDVEWAIGAVHVIRTAALGGQPPYCERWFMYAEDMDLCWRLDQAGWRRRLVSEVSVIHVANASGRLAFGDTRSARWWAASYDWYRFRRGVPAARRWATANALGATKMLLQYRLAQRLVGRRARLASAQAGELRKVLPLHWQMRRHPGTAFVPDEG
ncbi:MAG TPA: glycosyltransferase family 2 protein [Acidimicrobiales bacterium]|jgi:GT2 family glycosyltransferase